MRILASLRASSPRPRPAIRLVACVAAACALLHATSSAVAQPSFRGLGTSWSTQFPPTYPIDISADGQTVACSIPGPDRPGRWTEADGLQFLPGGLWTSDISADGSQIVGWNGGAGVLWIGSADPIVLSAGFRPFGMSPAGEFFAGVYETINNPASLRFGYPIVELPTLPCCWQGQAFSVSADGGVIVGYNHTSLGGGRAVRWTTAEGVIDLDPSHLYGSASAEAVSPDGATIFGYAGGSAFRWTAETGMVQLANPGYSFVTVTSAAEDESFVVGWGSVGVFTRALIWNRAGRCRDVAQFLRGIGVSEADGWQLLYARDISADGQTMVGVGLNPAGRYEHWLARIGPLCPGDANVDGAVDLSDLATLLAHFGLAPNAARIDGDMDDDGDVELDDLALILSEFGSTCGN